MLDARARRRLEPCAMMKGAPLTLDLSDEAATAALGARLARLLRPGDVVGLSGPLGAGKSVLARGAIRALLGPDTEAPSPTFALVQIYEAPELALWHFDLYRLERPEEAWELGLEDAFADAASLIEWPERLGPLAPADMLHVTLEPAGNLRRARLEGSAAWTDRIAGLTA